MTTYFVPCNTTALSHFFNKGLIVPSIILNNKPRDIQNDFPDYLLLSSFKWVKDCNAAIEIVLTEEETTMLTQINEGFFLLSVALPISRVKKVWFLEQEQLETTLWNINNGAGFLNKSLAVTDSLKNNKVYEFEFSSELSLPVKADISHKVKLFDQLLGSLAIMRIAGGTDYNFSYNYIFTLSHFNSVVQQELQSAIENDTKFSTRFIDFVTNKHTGWEILYRYFQNPMTDEEIINLAKREKITIIKQYGSLLLDGIPTDSVVFYLVLLKIHGIGGVKGEDDLLSLLLSSKTYLENREEALFLLGYHLGYSKLFNGYKVSGTYYPVKYDLISKLNYYTIETIYQYVFNDVQQSANFPYLDEWVPNKQAQKFRGFVTYRILDEVVKLKKKKSYSERYSEQFSNEITEIVSFKIKETLPSYLNLDYSKFLILISSEINNIVKKQIALVASAVGKEAEEYYSNTEENPEQRSMPDNKNKQNDSIDIHSDRSDLCENTNTNTSPTTFSNNSRTTTSQYLNANSEENLLVNDEVTPQNSNNASPPNIKAAADPKTRNKGGRTKQSANKKSQIKISTVSENPPQNKMANGNLFDGNQSKDIT
ncbi:MAG: hypothetical protein AMXMBFR48_21430 [Ignavibacteriales bacterium]